MEAKLSPATLQSNFLAGVAAGGGAIPSDLYRRIARIIEKKPANPEGYAFRAGKNLALDQHRSALAAARMTAKAVAAEAAETARIERDETMRERFTNLVRLVRARCDVNGAPPTTHHHLLTIHMTLIERASVETISAVFGGISRDLVYKWRERGRKLVAQHADDELLAWMTEAKYAQL